MLLYIQSWFPDVLENLEYNKLIFPVLEMSLNLTKSHGKNTAFGKTSLRMKE